MKTLKSALLIVGSLLPSAQAFAEDYDFKPGLWETTFTNEINQISVPAELEALVRSGLEQPMDPETQCIHDINELFDSGFSGREDEEESCNTEVNRINANRVNVLASCSSPQGTMQSEGVINLNGETMTYSGDVTTSGEAMGMKMNMIMKISGSAKYIGECSE
ncbi:DUF3617 domain-containing protein [Vibrio sp. RC27]